VFAFYSLLYHVPRGRASAEIFIPGSNTFLFEAMPHCARKHRTRQPECLCIASEIVAKLFLGSLVRSALSCISFEGTRIQVLSANPE
jgi:hypothetical protein